MGENEVDTVCLIGKLVSFLDSPSSVIYRAIKKKVK